MIGRLPDAVNDAKLCLSNSVDPVCKAAAAYSCTNTSAVSEKLFGSFGSSHRACPQCMQKVGKSVDQDEAI